VGDHVGWYVDGINVGTGEILGADVGCGDTVG